MHKIFICIKFIIFFIFIIFSSKSYARFVGAYPSFQQAINDSDLVTIATPIYSEKSIYKKLIEGLKGHNMNYEVFEADTTFEVKVVFKGDIKLKNFILRYYTPVNSVAVMGEPNLLEFNILQNQNYILFLKYNSFGYYVPAGGQIDPAKSSVFLLKNMRDQ